MCRTTPLPFYSGIQSSGDRWSNLDLSSLSCHFTSSSCVWIKNVPQQKAMQSVPNQSQTLKLRVAHVISMTLPSLPTSPLSSLWVAGVTAVRWNDVFLLCFCHSRVTCPVCPPQAISAAQSLKKSSKHHAPGRLALLFHPPPNFKQW